MDRVKLLETKIDLRHCPFCGSPPKSHEYQTDLGGGVIQFVACVCCLNRDCSVRPILEVRGLDSLGVMLGIAKWNQRVIEGAQK